MLERQIMFKQLQELQRQRQQLQELGETRQPNYLNQFPTLNSQLIDGTPINPSLLHHGISPVFQNGSSFSQYQDPTHNFFGQSPVHDSNNGVNFGNPSFSGQEQARWPAGLFPTANVGLSQGFASLDPLEQKILFNQDDNNEWDPSFGKNKNLGFENTFENIDSKSAFGSIQSGSWSALMQSAVAETSSGNVQEEWSGLSFQNLEHNDSNTSFGFPNYQQLGSKNISCQPTMFLNMNSNQGCNNMTGDVYNKDSSPNSFSGIPRYDRTFDQEARENSSDSYHSNASQRSMAGHESRESVWSQRGDSRFVSGNNQNPYDVFGQNGLLHHAMGNSGVGSVINEDVKHVQQAPRAYSSHEQGQFKVIDRVSRSGVELKKDPRSNNESPTGFRSSNTISQQSGGSSNMLDLFDKVDNSKDRGTQMKFVSSEYLGLGLAPPPQRPPYYPDSSLSSPQMGNQLQNQSFPSPHLEYESHNQNPSKGGINLQEIGALSSNSHGFHHQISSHNLSSANSINSGQQRDNRGVASDIEAFGRSLRQSDSLLRNAKNLEIPSFLSGSRIDHSGKPLSSSNINGAPSWFKQYETLKNGHVLPMYDKRAAANVAQQFSFENLPMANSRVQVSSADDSQFSSFPQGTATMSVAAQHTSPPPQVLPPDVVTDQNLSHLAPKKRKQPLSWHKEVTQGSRKLPNISMVELEWAKATNRLVGKDEAGYRGMSRPKKRLILTTQLMRQLFQPPEAVVLSGDATSNRDNVVYVAARLALGDACCTSGNAQSPNGEMSPENPNPSEPTGEEQKFSKIVEDFLARSKRLEDEISRLEKRGSIADMRVESQELEKFSVINRFAKFHIRGHPDSSSSFSGQPQRYVTAFPMPTNVPDGAHCLSL